jgi:hypothetical protein
LKLFLSLAIAFVAMVSFSSADAQTSNRSMVIGEMVTRPNALLVLNPSGSDQGFLLPQLTTGERTSIRPSSPEEDGLVVFDITEKEFYYWKNNGWVKGLGTASANGIPTLQSYSVDPSDFFGVADDKPDKHNAVVFDDNSTFITIQKKGDGSVLMAPFHLPDGAVIQQVQLYYVDRDPQNFTLTVYRRPFTGGNETIVNTWTSAGSSASIQTATLSPVAGKETINNEVYSYRILIDLNPSSDSNNSSEATHRIYGVKVKFQK